jgi:hypothetical protein
MTDAPTPPPGPFIAYGVLGLIPFLAPLAGLICPGLRDVSGAIQAIYAALILSFLGGTRWTLAAISPSAGPGLVTLTMLPTLAGLALLLLPAQARALQLAGLGLALAAQGVWDARAQGMPQWYAGLRSRLTLMAMAGLVLGALLAHGG